MRRIGPICSRRPALSIVETFPLNSCKIAPENARHASKADVGGLACGFRRDRARHSDLMPPTVPI
jgi:hypothetical protein